MSEQLLKNTGKLSGFFLRRDRLRIPIWLLSITALTLAIASYFTNLYPTAQEREAIAATMENPAMIAMVGPGYGLDNYTFGAMMAHQMLLLTAVAVGIMNILLVTRHTRSDEEAGRIEMIRSLPTGRLANLSAAIAVLFGTNGFLALAVGFGLFALQIESMDLFGSLLYGAALGATGIFFTGLTALFAQLTSSSRGTTGLSISALLLAYLIRGIGDVSYEALSWLSPFGWILKSEVYVNNYWWPILLTLGVSLFLVILAFYLNRIRDLEAGFLPAKPGRKTASPLLQSPLALMIRLQRTSIIAWAIGLYVLGASYGSVMGDLEDFFDKNEALQQLLKPVPGFSLTEQFIPLLMTIMAIISTIPTLMALLKLSSEEKKNRTESLLALAISRTRLLGSSFVVAVATSLIILSCAVIGLWSAGAATMDEPISLGTYYKAALVYLPAIWAMIGLTVLLIGIAPRWTNLTWAYLIYSFVVVYLGRLLEFPEWMSNLSPYGHIPQLPVEEMDFMNISFVTLVALGLTIIGFIGYNRRDIYG